MKKILIAEDDIQLIKVLEEYFLMENFTVIKDLEGELTIDFIDRQESVDLFLIDISLPFLNGLDILEYIRRKDLITPVIIITASLEIQNLTKAFSLGCNDYIKKPFHIKELEARVEKISQECSQSKITLQKDLIFDTLKKSLFYNNQEIPLRLKEQKLLEILVLHRDTTVTNETIYDYVWPEGKESYPLRQLVNDLRKKVPVKFIHTKVKLGYCITTPSP